jgi:xylulokinase
LRVAGVPVQRAFLIGGAAQSEAVQQLAPGILGLEVLVPTPGEYVADGAARQAAWVLSGADAQPEWSASGAPLVLPADQLTPQVREQYAEVRELTANR